MPPAGAQRVLRCPVCGLSLQPFTHAGVTVDACLECGGIWLDAKRIEHVLGAPAGSVVPRRAASDTGPQTRRPCPGGHGVLRAMSPGAGVEVDRCPECMGMWFEGGEVARVARIVRAARRGPGASDVLERRAHELQHEVDYQHAVLKQEYVEAPEGSWLFQWLTDLPQEVYSPVSERPLATYGLIAACVLVFALQLMSAIQWTTAGMLIDRWGLVPSVLLRGVAPWTLITSMFMHGDPYHLAGNMYFLWVFGDNVEDRLGRGRYLALYLLGGVAATVAHVVSDPRSTIPVVGASGAISAVMGAYVYFFPDRRLYMMIFYSLRRIRAIWYLGIWLLIQIYLAAAGAPGVAWWAHIGGFVFGAGAAAFYRHRLATRIEALERSGGVTR